MPGRAGPSRSQRSQREPQPSQYRSQRARERQVDTEDDDSSDDNGVEMEADDDMQVEHARGAEGDDVSPTRFSFHPFAHTHASTLTRKRAI